MIARLRDRLLDLALGAAIALLRRRHPAPPIRPVAVVHYLGEDPAGIHLAGTVTRPSGDPR